MNLEKITKINSSLKCHYSKVVKNESAFFRKELYLKESPWIERFLNEIEFYENKQKFPKIEDYLPSLELADKTHLKMDLIFIENQMIIADRYIDSLPDKVLSMFFDFSLSCLHYHQKDEKLIYFQNRLEKIKKSNLVNSNTIDFLSKNALFAQNLFLSHGDAIPKNLLLSAENKLKIIDWEFYAYRPKFFDLSLLYITLKSNRQKEKILTFVKENEGLNPFLIGLIINLEKELRIHLVDESIQYELEYLQTINNLLENIR